MKNQLKLFLMHCFTVVLMFSCVNKKKENEHEKQELSNKLKSIQDNQEDSNTDFEFNTFTSIPEEIDGCGCYFYLNNDDEKAERYIFVNDFANVAFILINGKLTRFELEKHMANESIYIYNSGQYNIRIQILKKQNHLQETSKVSGFMSVTKGNKTIKKEFTGYCGC